MIQLFKNSILIAVCAATWCGGTNCFAAPAAEATTAVPINSRMTSVRFPHDFTLDFVRYADSPHLLIGPDHWRAIERPEKRMLNAFSDDPSTGIRQEYCFIDGKLRFSSYGKQKNEIKPSDLVFPTNSLASLWPTESARREHLKNHNFWHDGGGRLRLFSSNPNRSAIIFTQLALIFLCLCLASKRYVFRIPFAAFFLTLAFMTLLTQSRGGLLALFAGIAAALFFRFRRQLSWRRMIVGFAIAITVLSISYQFVRLQRSQTAGDSERSSSRRVHIWREAPRMIAAAPMGWGLWQSGQAYNSWFEKPNRLHMTGDLFNDHLSRFVEGGFLFGGLYIFVWILLLTLSCRHAWRGGSPLPVAIFTSYFVASSFNPLLYWPPSLYLVGITILATTANHLRKHKLHTSTSNLQPPTFNLPFTFTFSATIALLGVIAVVAFCSGPQDVPLRVSPLGHRVIVGEGEPQVWVADDGFVLCGDYNGFPGRELRDFYRQHPDADAIGLVEDLSHLPPGVKQLVVTGKLCEEFLQDPARYTDEQAILYSPPFGSDRIPPELQQQFQLQLLTGEFAAHRTGDHLVRKNWVHVVPGAELYIPHWLDMIVTRK